MNKLLGSVLALTLISFSYAEEEGPQKGQMLEEAKAHALSMIDMRIKALQDSKTCVNNAKSKEDMHACRKEAKEDMKEFKGAREEKRKEWKEKREEWKGKREEWKKNRKEMRGGPKQGGEETEAPPAE